MLYYVTNNLELASIKFCISTIAPHIGEVRMSTKYIERVTPVGTQASRLEELPDLIEIQRNPLNGF